MNFCIAACQLAVVFLFFTSTLQAQLLTPDVDSIPMRDGKKLAADIHRPNSTDTFSTILIMTPYNRLFYRFGLPIGTGLNIDSSKYAFVIVDWRCFFGSIPACDGPAKNGEDGYDVIDWIVQQSWSNGKVGTWGPSALGKVQFLTLKEKHPNHICAVPLVAGPQFNYQEYFPGGAARTEYIEQLDGLGFALSGLLYANPVYNLTWFVGENNTFYPADIEKPVFMIGGWYDHNVEVMISFFDGLLSSSPASSDHKLLFGPWAHGGFGQAQVGTGQQGELFYPEAAGWSDSLALRFFDYWLGNEGNGWQNQPTVNYFQMGENVWDSSPSWPPQSTISDTLYFQAGGLLKENPDTGSNIFSSITYNPRDPSPTIGGATLRQDLDQGPYDQAQIVEIRNDILTFSTTMLSTPIRVKGKILILVYVSSDRLDTDFVARLTDVYPDGRSMLINESIQRMRFRNGYWAVDTAAMIPGTVYPIMIELPELAYTWQAGHRLRLNITSSNYPRFDSNLNNGGAMYTAGDTLIATNQLFHDADYPSSIVLPVTDSISTHIGNGNMFHEMKLFPNPAEDKLHISFQRLNNSATLNVKDMNGKVLVSNAIQQGTQKHSFDISFLPPGIYLVELKSKSFNIVRKVVIARDN